ncbi:MAG: MATE family efflux transporter [Myxococcales bacterium 68-20]|nr:MAG: MATE family efflux transporter [Myxococcales bacterium 68-20]
MAASRQPHALLTEGAIGKTLLVFSLPILATNVLQSLNGSVNAVWVGRYLGAAALTATSNANTIVFLLIGAMFGLGMAAAIMLGQSIGAKDVEGAKRVVGTSVAFFFYASLVVAIAGFVFSPTILDWMRTPDDALPYAIAYLRVVFLATPFAFVSAIMTMLLRGAGDARTPLVYSALAVGLDVALNPLFIFGAGPIPALGIAGSAVAALIANALACFALLGHLYGRKHDLRLRRDELRYLRIDRAVLGALVRKGTPMGLQMIVMTASAVVMTSLVNRFGSATAAAYGAALQLWNYIQMPAIAIGMAASSMAAQNVGARLWERVGRVAVVGVAINFGMTGALAIIIHTFDRSALGLFLADSEAIAIAVHLNTIVVWSFTLFGVSMVLSSVVRSTGAVAVPLAILVVALWCVRMPFAVALLDRWQADAIWWSFPLGSITSMVLSIAYYRYGGWRQARMT